MDWCKIAYVSMIIFGIAAVACFIWTNVEVAIIKDESNRSEIAAYCSGGSLFISAVAFLFWNTNCIK